ncbi:MAG: hypothetical protein GX072_04205, partial [Lysinibacillus sp.]|nr:hypothetical protein [Lysinibacillus sp.]
FVSLSMGTSIIAGICGDIDELCELIAVVCVFIDGHFDYRWNLWRYE